MQKNTKEIKLYEQMKKLGYEYDLLRCGWYRFLEGNCQSANGTFKFNTNTHPEQRLFFPPFGITDKELLERISSKKLSSKKLGAEIKATRRNLKGKK